MNIEQTGIPEIGECCVIQEFGGEEIFNLGLFAQTLHDLKGVSKVEIRMIGRVSAISQEEVVEATRELILPGQFVLLEGNLHKNAEEWVNETNYAVKTVQSLVAIARNEEDLPEDNLMFALYAAYLDISLEEFARLTKKDD